MTSDPVHPWLDPAEVRRMAERLIRPGGEAPPDVSDAGFNEQFIGFVAPPTAALAAKEDQGLPTTSPEPVAAPRETVTPDPVSASADPAPVPSPEPEPHTTTEPVDPVDPRSPRGPFLHRVQQFSDWLIKHFGISGVFILDRDGSCIFDDGSHSKLHFLARGLAFATRQPGSIGGNVHVKISAQTVLEVIPVDTAYGLWVLGIAVQQALAPAAVESVKQALTQVAAPPHSETTHE